MPLKYVHKLKDLEISKEDEKCPEDATMGVPYIDRWTSLDSKNKSITNPVVPIVYPAFPLAASHWVGWVECADASLAQDSEGKSQMAWLVAFDIIKAEKPTLSGVRQAGSNCSLGPPGQHSSCAGVSAMVTTSSKLGGWLDKST
eukprot:1668382-Amphidinium_carterae.2